MDGFKLGRLYKGEEYTMTLPVPFSGEVDDFQFLLFTDSATTVEIPKAQITIEDGVMEFTVQETDLDVLNDGVLNYYLKYTVGSTDKIQCTNTMHYLKSPSDYNPKTTQDIYNEGYEAGVEAGSGDYSEGFVDGEQAQKNKLTGITINQNGTYQREDGYNNVIVSVPQTQYNSQSKNYNLTSNGATTITPDAGYDGITGGTITVDVPQTGGTFVTQRKNYNITANGTTTITPDAGYDGITGGTINVNVPKRIQEKTVGVFNIGNGQSSYDFYSDTGYDGMSKIRVYIKTYLQNQYNAFRFTVYFDDTQDEYYIFDMLAGYGLIDNPDSILEFKVDGSTDYMMKTFLKNTSHTFYMVGPEITTLLLNFKYNWTNGGYRIVWNSWTSYNGVIPALYVSGIPTTYTSTTLTLDNTDLINGQMCFDNVTKLEWSGDMNLLNKDSFNLQNCAEIWIDEDAQFQFPNVINYNDGDVFNLPNNGIIYAPDDEYITNWVTSETEGTTRFIFLLPNGGTGWTIVPINPITP